MDRPVDIRLHDGIALAELHLQDRLDDDALDAIEGLLVDQLAEQADRIIVDFSDVPFLASKVLMMIVTLNNRIAEHGGRLVLAGLTSPLMDVFRLTRLDHLLTFAETPDQALLVLGGSARGENRPAHPPDA